MKKLAASTSFEFLDFGLAEPLPAEGDSLLSVKKDAFWSYCGPLLSKQDDLPPSIHEWTHAALSSSILPVLLPFLTFVNEFVKANGLDNYWLTIRATKATVEYDRPRWHTDDMFFARSGGGSLVGEPVTDGKKKTKTKTKAKPKLDLQTDWKLCATLLGPSTMFIPPEHQEAARSTSRTTKRALATDHSCTSIRCVGCASTAEAVRDELSTKLTSLGLVQARPGECSVFRIGQERGAVHSEPSMSHGDRIFVNVVPGKRDELAGLVSKWGMNFPRSWWIAPNMSHVS